MQAVVFREKEKVKWISNEKDGDDDDDNTAGSLFSKILVSCVPLCLVG